MKTQARDMTEGSIAKNIILFYIPLAIGGLFQQLYSFVDSVVVGRGIGAQALAAVGATSIVVWLTLGFAMGLTRGFCIHISQAYGKKDYHLVNRGFFVASVLSLIVGTMISIVGSLVIRNFLILMHTPGEILEQSRRGGILCTIGHDAHTHVALHDCLIERVHIHLLDRYFNANLFQVIHNALSIGGLVKDSKGQNIALVVIRGSKVLLSLFHIEFGHGNCAGKLTECF